MPKFDLCDFQLWKISGRNGSSPPEGLEAEWCLPQLVYTDVEITLWLNILSELN